MNLTRHNKIKNMCYCQIINTIKYASNKIVIDTIYKHNKIKYKHKYIIILKLTISSTTST